MAATLTDEELIRQYLSEDPSQCFETLYNRYVNKVYRRCLSMTQDSALAKDFTHDIFIKVFSKLGNFKERSTFSTWLHAISSNYCLDQLRVAKRRNTVAFDTDDDHDLADSDDALQQQETLHLLNQAMAKLSTEEKAMLQLKYEKGLSIDAIAEQYNINPSAVKMRLKRSRDKVYRMCEQQLAQ
ncbi:RNA polymerase sigma factor [Spirosoma knui]